VWRVVSRIRLVLSGSSIWSPNSVQGVCIYRVWQLMWKYSRRNIEPLVSSCWVFSAQKKQVDTWDLESQLLSCCATDEQLRTSSRLSWSVVQCGHRVWMAGIYFSVSLRNSTLRAWPRSNTWVFLVCIHQAFSSRPVWVGTSLVIVLLVTTAICSRFLLPSRLRLLWRTKIVEICDNKALNFFLPLNERLKCPLFTKQLKQSRFRWRRVGVLKLLECVFLNRKKSCLNDPKNNNFRTWTIN
jgi:hypothetical protein